MQILADVGVGVLAEDSMLCFSQYFSKNECYEMTSNRQT